MHIEIIEIIENPAVAEAGAVWAKKGDRTIIVIDPNLDADTRRALIEELTG